MTKRARLVVIDFINLVHFVTLLGGIVLPIVAAFAARKLKQEVQ